MNIVCSAISLTWATHSVLGRLVGLDRRRGRASRMCSMAPEIHSTCCSIDTGMLLSTDGLSPAR